MWITYVCASQITNICAIIQRPKNACLKRDLLCKKHIYKVFEHSCVATVCENNQPLTVKIHPLIYYNQKNHKQSLRMSCFRLSLCSRHWGEKVPPICDAVWMSAPDKVSISFVSEIALLKELLGTL